MKDTQEAKNVNLSIMLATRHTPQECPRLPKCEKVFAFDHCKSTASAGKQLRVFDRSAWDATGKPAETILNRATVLSRSCQPNFGSGLVEKDSLRIVKAFQKYFDDLIREQKCPTEPGVAKGMTERPSSIRQRQIFRAAIDEAPEIGFPFPKETKQGVPPFV